MHTLYAICECDIIHFFRVEKCKFHTRLHRNKTNLKNNYSPVVSTYSFYNNKI